MLIFHHLNSGDVCIWDPKTGNRRGKILSGHKKWISCLTWRPLHCAKDQQKCFLASGSKDGSIKVILTFIFKLINLPTFYCIYAINLNIIVFYACSEYGF